MPMIYHGEAAISSSRIRQALARGDIASANYMLGRHYSLSGKVLHGKTVRPQARFPND